MRRRRARRSHRSPSRRFPRGTPLWFPLAAQRIDATLTGGSRFATKPSHACAGTVTRAPSRLACVSSGRSLQARGRERLERPDGRAGLVGDERDRPDHGREERPHDRAAHVTDDRPPVGIDAHALEVDVGERPLEQWVGVQALREAAAGRVAAPWTERDAAQANDASSPRREAAGRGQHGVDGCNLECVAPAEDATGLRHTKRERSATVRFQARREGAFSCRQAVPLPLEDLDVAGERLRRRRACSPPHRYADVTRTGIALSAFVKLVRTRRTGPASSMSARRGSSSSNIT